MSKQIDQKHQEVLQEEDFDRLSETWSIFITKNDITGKWLLPYPIELPFRNQKN